GLKCGITRVEWGTDGSLWCGMTNRGWGSLGQAEYGLQRLCWRGVEPFDLLEVTARPDGFRLRFSQPVAEASAVPASFALQNWAYDLHEDYGCPERDRRELPVVAVTAGGDGTTIDLRVEGLSPTRVHQIDCKGVRSRSGSALWHPVAWYTLNSLPRSATGGAGEFFPAGAAPASEPRTPASLSAMDQDRAASLLADLRWLQALARRLAADPDAAADAVQDTAITALQHGDAIAHPR